MSFNNNFSNRAQRITPIVLNLIIINGLIYISQFFLGKSFNLAELFALYPYGTELFKPYQLVTHMFTHVEFFHILLNMYGLWMFGTILEKKWGPRRFLIFYLACGLAAGVAQALLVHDAAAIGASGAVMGLLAAFGMMFPNTQFFIIPIPFPIKAKYLVAIVAAIDIFSGINPNAKDNIAHFAHLGGLVMGLVLVLIWKKTDKKTFH